ncbi:hypothetical protein [Sulfurihydrogenibium yellowstonense]|uniref:hypothetical protein n=1 Tax=Sulfurihydrogenibium yellowstonense TaxID=304736 RepID=UPI0012EA89E0|nr:hypothetical protein [Sulfurihydrogenibium yellowstonense]
MASFEVAFISLLRLLVKIHTVILSEAKNLIFFFSSQKIKKEILRAKALRMIKKVKTR